LIKDFQCFGSELLLFKINEGSNSCRTFCPLKTLFLFDLCRICCCLYEIVVANLDIVDVFNIFKLQQQSGNL